MLQQVQNFIDDHFFLVWCVGVAVCLLVFAAMAWRRISRGPQFPSLATVKVLHRERFASGCSHRSLLTRLGGANNMLRVILTDSELWITTIAFFRGIAAFYDLDHRISLVDITSVEDRGKTVLIQFNRPDRSNGKLHLRLRDKRGFMDKLNSLMQR
jgi:hypothetical protein